MSHRCIYHWSVKQVVFPLASLQCSHVLMPSDQSHSNHSNLIRGFRFTVSIEANSSKLLRMHRNFNRHKNSSLTFCLSRKQALLPSHTCSYFLRAADLIFSSPLCSIHKRPSHYLKQNFFFPANLGD